MDDLQQLRRLVSELNTTNSTTDKMAILKKFPQCKEILRWTYDPFKQFFVSSANILKLSNQIQLSNKHFSSIYELLSGLDERKFTGHEAISHILQFLEDNKAYHELILNILDRNLKTRVDAKLINKLWPNTIPSFEVALANKYADVKDRVKFDKDIWFASRKLDGVRVITMINGADVKFFSRKGKEFITLAEVKKEILKKFKPETSLVLDGEMCIVNKNGDENFADIIKLIRRKDFTIPNPKYKIFDVLPISVFEGTTFASPLLHERLKMIENYKATGIFDGKILDPVEQRRIRTEKDLTDFMAEANSKDWEGLILRKDVAYEGKRSNDMLKVKEMQDMEFTVKDVEMGPIRIIKEGKEITEVMLSAIKVAYKNNIVSIGSGFSIEQRQEFYKDPKKILGKTVTIQYFEETKNEQGLYSLRFPVVKVIYDEGRDI